MLDALDTLASEVEETRMCGTSGRQGESRKGEGSRGGKARNKNGCLPSEIISWHASREREREKEAGQTV